MTVLPLSNYKFTNSQVQICHDGGISKLTLFC